MNTHMSLIIILLVVSCNVGITAVTLNSQYSFHKVILSKNDILEIVSLKIRKFYFYFLLSLLLVLFLEGKKKSIHLQGHAILL